MTLHADLVQRKRDHSWTIVIKYRHV